MNEENNSMPQGEPAKSMSPNKVMAVLAYIGPLLIVSYLTAKDDPMVKFHIKQGLVLLVIEVALWVLGSVFIPFLWQILNLINLGVVILSIIGIVNVLQGKEKELPLIGKFSSYFNSI